ncbi:MAG TPA: porin [Chthonomonadales bacterium]|nr:porin [Chthonomonadales bacterium]
MSRSCWALAGALICLLAWPALAQAPHDVPRDHWAYEAVEELAQKGMIRGYPPEGDFFGTRTVTRYEMATIVQRALARVGELLAAGAARAGTTGAPVREGAAPAAVRPEDLDEVRRLVHEFRLELGNIGTDLQQVRNMIDDLRNQVAGARTAAETAAQTAGQVKTDLDALKSEFGEVKESMSVFRSEYEVFSRAETARRLSGYLQARFEAFEPGNSALFPSDGTGGTGQAPTVGGPAVGGPRQGWLVRRARLRFSGRLTNRTEWDMQLDAPSIGGVNLRNASVTLSDLPLPAQWTTTVGLFKFPFGLEHTISSAARESPERAVGFADSALASPIFNTSVSATGGVVTPGSALPMWVGQDRDVGAMISFHAPNVENPVTRAFLGVFNGEGRATGGMRNTNDALDLMARAQTSLMSGHLDLGVSAYYGTMAVRGGPPAGTPAAPVPFVNANRMLLGADLRYFMPWGTVLRAEWMGGVYEVTPDRARYLQGNRAHAWYVSLRHPLNRRLEIAAKYDEFYPISQRDKTAGGLGRIALARRSYGVGALYHFDDATRFRLWYQKGLTPFDPAAPAGSPRRARLGFLTAEVQVSY